MARADFSPQVGSDASYAGVRVRIHRRNADGTFTILGDRLHRQVTADELRPARTARKGTR